MNLSLRRLLSSHQNSVKSFKTSSSALITRAFVVLAILIFVLSVFILVVRSLMEMSPDAALVRPGFVRI